MRFTIRETLLVTAIVAMVIGWTLDHYHLSRDLELARHVHKRAARWETQIRDELEKRNLTYWSPDGERILIGDSPR